MSYDFSCAMVYLPKDSLTEVQKGIDPSDLYTAEPDYGLDLEPHVTVLYGLHTNNWKEAQGALDKAGLNLVRFKLTKLSLFENSRYDVLKYEVESEDLHALNKALRKVPYTSSYPEYKPHATVAYLKPGTGKKYIGGKARNESFEVLSWVFSPAEGVKSTHAINPNFVFRRLRHKQADVFRGDPKKTFYHGSPNPNIVKLNKGSYVTADKDTATLMGRFFTNTGKQWTDDDLFAKHEFGKEPEFLNVPDGIPTLYRFQAKNKDLDLMDNPYEHKTRREFKVEKIAGPIPGLSMIGNLFSRGKAALSPFAQKAQNLIKYGPGQTSVLPSVTSAASEVPTVLSTYARAPQIPPPTGVTPAAVSTGAGPVTRAWAEHGATEARNHFMRKITRRMQDAAPPAVPKELIGTTRIGGGGESEVFLNRAKDTVLKWLKQSPMHSEAGFQLNPDKFTRVPANHRYRIAALDGMDDVQRGMMQPVQDVIKNRNLVPGAPKMRHNGLVEDRHLLSQPYVRGTDASFKDVRQWMRSNNVVPLRKLTSLRKNNGFPEDLVISSLNTQGLKPRVQYSRAGVARVNDPIAGFIPRSRYLLMDDIKPENFRFDPIKNQAVPIDIMATKLKFRQAMEVPQLREEFLKRVALRTGIGAVGTGGGIAATMGGNNQQQ